jgi:hypothetical protein
MSFNAGFNEAAAAAKPSRLASVSWQTRAVLAVLLLVLVIAAGAVMSALLPVWWATTIGSHVGGDLGGSILTGMVIGFAFTLAPLLAAWLVRYSRASWPWKAAIMAAALLLAVPNLLTAGIAFDTSSSARQARRILGTEATWFIEWTLYAAVAAVLVFTAFVVLTAAWRHRGRTLEQLRITPEG